MLLKESAFAHHLRATSYRHNVKIAWKQRPVAKMVGKMPTKVCVNTKIVAGILPTLPRRRVSNRMIQQVFIAWQDGKTPMLLNALTVAHLFWATPYRYNAKIVWKQFVVVKAGGQNAGEGLCKYENCSWHFTHPTEA